MDSFRNDSMANKVASGLDLNEEALYKNVYDVIKIGKELKGATKQDIIQYFKDVAVTTRCDNKQDKYALKALTIQLEPIVMSQEVNMDGSVSQSQFLRMMGQFLTSVWPTYRYMFFLMASGHFRNLYEH